MLESIYQIIVYENVKEVAVKVADKGHVVELTCGDERLEFA